MKTNAATTHNGETSGGVGPIVARKAQEMKVAASAQLVFAADSSRKTEKGTAGENTTAPKDSGTARNVTTQPTDLERNRTAHVISMANANRTAK